MRTGENDKPVVPCVIADCGEVPPGAGKEGWKQLNLIPLPSPTSFYSSLTLSLSLDDGVPLPMDGDFYADYPGTNLDRHALVSHETRIQRINRMCRLIVTNPKLLIL